MAVERLPERMNDDLAIMHAAMSGEPDPEIIALEARLRSAQLAADVVELDALIAERLLFTGPDGQVGTKAQDLDAHRSGIVRFRAHEPEELHVRRIGGAAICARLRDDTKRLVTSDIARGNLPSSAAALPRRAAPCERGVLWEAIPESGFGESRSRQP